MRVSLRLFEICGKFRIILCASFYLSLYSFSHYFTHSVNKLRFEADRAACILQIFAQMFIVIWISLFKRWVAPEVHFPWLFSVSFCLKYTFRSPFVCTLLNAITLSTFISLLPFVHAFSKCPIFQIYIYIVPKTHCADI